MDKEIKNEIARIKRELTSIEDKYDAEEDVIPGAPKVLYMEMRLVRLIQSTLSLIEGLQRQADELKNKDREQ